MLIVCSLVIVSVACHSRKCAVASKIVITFIIRMSFFSKYQRWLLEKWKKKKLNILGIKPQ